MPRDAAPAPIHATISMVVVVNKLGGQLHSHEDQDLQGRPLLLPSKIRSQELPTRLLKQQGFMDQTFVWSRIYHASPTAAYVSQLLMSSTS